MKRMTVLRTFVTVAIAALFLFLAAPPMFVNSPVAYTGMQRIGGPPLGRMTIRVIPGSPAARSGLRTGDVVGCMSLRDRETLLQLEGVPSPFVPGVTIPVCAQRHGAWQAFTVLPERRPAPGLLYGSIWLTVMRLVVFAIFLLVGIVLLAARPSPLTWIFFAYCLASVPSYAAWVNDTTLPAPLYWLVVTLLVAFVWAGGGLMLMFALVVPDDSAPQGWRRKALWIAAALALASFIRPLVLDALPDFYLERYITVTFDYVVTGAIVLVVVVRLVLARGQERARFGWAAVAILAGIAVNDIRNQFTSGNLNQLGSIFGVLTIVTPLALMYAILMRHVIDVRFVISRTAVYAALTTLVVGIIGLVDWATSAYLQQARAAMAIDALVTIALGFALHRTYRWLERSVDVLLFREKHEAAEYLHRLGRTLLRAKREETIARALVHDPYEKLHLTMAAFFRAEASSFTLSCAAGWDHPNAPVFDAEHDVIRFLTTERNTLHLNELRPHVAAQLHDGEMAPAIVIPIFQGDDLFAFALYGVHRDGTKLDPDEVQTLEGLCDVAAQAYSRVENLQYRELVRVSSHALSS